MRGRQLRRLLDLIRDSKSTVNYPALKGEASNFNGNGVNRRLASSATTYIASISSPGDPRRDDALRLKCDIFGGIDISVVQTAAFIALPCADIQS